MIPALLALPLVEGAIGSVAGLFAPHGASGSSSAAFNPYLQRATQAADSGTPNFSAPSGSLTSTEWSQMSDSDVQSWMKGLAGKHVHATDISGRTISGVVNGFSENGGVPTLNVGGHLVSLSSVNQITWSPAIH